MSPTASPASTPPSTPDLKLVPVPQPSVVAPPRTMPRRPKPRRTRVKWIVASVLGVAVIASVQLWRTSATAIVTHYVTAPITRGSVVRAVTASGSVSPEITVQVGTYVSGVIEELYCDYNTRVHKGQLCARIDPRPYQTVVEQNRANLAMANAQLAKDQTSLSYARATYNRTADLYARRIVSQDALDAAQSALDQSAAQITLDNATIEQRKAALRAAEINLAYTNIVSPVEGTVVSRSVTVGQTVAASFQTPTLFVIATDLTKMQVDANVSESDIGGIHVGNTASFTVEAYPEHTFEGRVTQVRQAPQTVQNVVTYDVVVGVPNPDLLLKPGMTATVRVVVDRRDDVLRVPDQALRYTPAASGSAAEGRGGVERHQRQVGHHVWLLRRAAPAEVPVTIGLNDDANAELLSGEVKEGDEVVTAEQTRKAATSSPFRFFRF